MDNTSTNGLASFPNGEPHSLFAGDRNNELDDHLNTVTGHNHLGLLVLVVHDAGHLPRHVGGSHVKLRPVPCKERRVSPTFLLLQNINNGLELRVGRNGARLCQNHPSLNVHLLNPSEQQPHVVPRQRLVKNLLEHLHACHRRVPRFPQTHKVNGVANFYRPTLHSPRRHRPTPGDCENVFHGQKEREFGLALRNGNVVVHFVHQLVDFIHPFVVAAFDCRVLHESFQSQECGARDDGDVVAGELVRREKLAHFQFHQLEEFFVVDLVLFVQEHHHVGHADLFCQQDVFFRLGHGAVGAGHHQDGAVHLGGAGDHVLDVVRVAGAVHVSVVAVFSFVFHGGGVDGDAAGALLRGGVDLVVLLGGAVAEGGEGHGEGGGEGGLAVVDVADGAYVDVGLLALKLAARGTDGELAAVGCGGGCAAEDGGGLEEGGRESGWFMGGGGGGGAEGCRI